MIVLGVDPHKDLLVVVAVDSNGRQLDVTSAPARPRGVKSLLRWARQYDERLWAVEDVRHVAGGLMRGLLAAGEPAVWVPTQLTARYRRLGRGQGKSDPIDALAVARAALREDLPPARPEDESRLVKMLLDHREDLVGEMVRMCSRLRWLLHDLDPDFAETIPARKLHKRRWVTHVRDYLAAQAGSVGLSIAAELLDRVEELARRADQLEREIHELMKVQAPQLLALPGCGPLSAARIVAETGDVRRFHSSAAFAMHTGTAPIPASSGATHRHRLNRGGNRRLNAAVHRIAITQARVDDRARRYLDNRKAMGNSRTEAIRALKRHLARHVYGLLHTAKRLSGEFPVPGQDGLPAAA